MNKIGSEKHELPLATLLSNHRRINVSRYLLEENPEFPVDVGQLAEGVAAIEYDKSAERVSGDEKHRVYVALIQSHLDPLDQENVVQFDSERKTVRPGANLRQFYAFAMLLLALN
ncbi:hypothetical protein [Natrinema sp. 1APR25-10V2]|uniref:DUF7344 domain-containing protein n=1 Tax=Natrinema sp. 1APR25-10V2 TaxID=2951081 RepID=UPI00287451D7|nr:hypothetical protein [Natrinema sp. 1APR25-10V2]MDS0473776.1 hypothetical protein [Natrinema sp. 1APR25-10V2]